MNKMIKKQTAQVFLSVLCAVSLIFCANLAFAQEEETAGQTTSEVSVGKGKRPDRRAELLKLKQEDPEKFKEFVGNKRQDIKKKLQHLKETDPEKYQRFMQQVRQRKLAKLKELKERDPEKFRELVEARKAKVQQRLQELKTKDPEKYRKLIAYKEKLGQLRQMRKENPEEFKKFIAQHPEIKERLQEKWSIRKQGHGQGHRGYGPRQGRGY